jgi:hypothetical protein
MKILIKEERRNDLIEKYILTTFPMVGKVTFETKKVQLASGENIRGENVINRTKIHIGFIDGKMTHSPSYMLKKIKTQLNPMFGLELDEYASDWGLEGKMIPQ